MAMYKAMSDPELECMSDPESVYKTQFTSESESKLDLSLWLPAASCCKPIVAPRCMSIAASCCTPVAAPKLCEPMPRTELEVMPMSGWEAMPVIKLEAMLIAESELVPPTLVLHHYVLPLRVLGL